MSSLFLHFAINQGKLLKSALQPKVFSGLWRDASKSRPKSSASCGVRWKHNGQSAASSAPGLGLDWDAFQQPISQLCLFRQRQLPHGGFDFNCHTQVDSMKPNDPLNNIFNGDISCPRILEPAPGRAAHDTPLWTTRPFTFFATNPGLQRVLDFASIRMFRKIRM
ncbi:MAG TPA: hypothetical protein VFC44_00380 [Candidatus Saccharimonadales bacterium]|nr:hypothetical protein [Candidatus Saccharimonadales bacterium]